MVAEQFIGMVEDVVEVHGTGFATTTHILGVDLGEPGHAGLLVALLDVGVFGIVLR